MMAALARKSKPAGKPLPLITPYQKRQHIEAMIDQLVSLLDAIDGDPDFEPDADLEPDNDDEPWLGWTADGDRGSGVTQIEVDREVDDDFEGEDIHHFYAKQFA